MIHPSTEPALSREVPSFMYSTHLRYARIVRPMHHRRAHTMRPGIVAHGRSRLETPVCGQPCARHTRNVRARVRDARVAPHGASRPFGWCAARQTVLDVRDTMLRVSDILPWLRSVETVNIIEPAKQTPDPETAPREGKDGGISWAGGWGGGAPSSGRVCERDGAAHDSDARTQICAGTHTDRS